MLLQQRSSDGHKMAPKTENTHSRGEPFTFWGWIFKELIQCSLTTAFRAIIMQIGNEPYPGRYQSIVASNESLRGREMKALLVTRDSMRGCPGGPFVV